MLPERLSEWLKNLKSSTNKLEQRSEKTSSFRPLVEMLEDRTTPAHLNVVSGGGLGIATFTGYSSTVQTVTSSLSGEGATANEWASEAIRAQVGAFDGVVEAGSFADFLPGPAAPGVDSLTTAASSQVSCEYQIAADGNEQVGDPVLLNVDVQESNNPAPASYPASYSSAFSCSVGGAATGSGLFLAHIGDLIDVNIQDNATVSAPPGSTISGSVDGRVNLTLASVTFSPDAGGPYSIADGNSLTLNASHTSNPDNLPLTYSWDVNVNGSWVNGVAAGQTPTLSPSQLQSLGITSANSPYQVRVEATDSSSGTPVISPATSLMVQQNTPTVVVNPVSVSYDGDVHGTTGEAFGLNGVDLGPVAITYDTADGSAPVDAGNYTATGTFAGNQDYPSATGTATISIGKAPLTIDVDNLTKTYGDAAILNDTLATGVNGESLDVSYASVGAGADADVLPGGYPITATVSDDTGKAANYSVSVNNGTLTVEPANALISIDSYNEPFDGNAHGISGTATGVLNEDLSDLLNLGPTFSNAGSNTVDWTFAGNDDYQPENGTSSVDISAVRPTASIAPVVATTYDGLSHGTTGQVLGVIGDLLSSAVIYADSQGNVLNGAPVNAGTYTATVSYAGDNDYLPASASTTIVIDKAHLTVSGITGANKIYDGLTTATIHKRDAVLVGVVSGDVGAVTLNKHSAIGTFTDRNVGIDKTVAVSGLTIGGTKSSNYILVQPTTTATIKPKALTVTGIATTSKVYDGTTDDPLSTSGATLVGVLDADVGTVTLNTTAAIGSFPNANVGTGKRVTVSGLVIDGADAGNYVLAQPTGLTADITVASPSFSMLSSPPFTHGKNTTAVLSGHLGEGVTNATGNVAITVTNADGVVRKGTVAIDANGDFLADFTHNWVAGMYTVAYHFAGNQDFNGADGTGLLVVN